MPKPKHGYSKPLTEEGKLTDRGKAKLRGQVKHAEMLMRTNVDWAGKKTKAYHAAEKTRTRALKLLGESPGKAVSPDKKGSTSSGTKYEKRRAPFEKATGTATIKKALIGVAKRAQRANGG